MGWASGASMAERLWDELKPYLKKKDIQKVAKMIIEVFEDQDCDTMEEAHELWEDAGYCSCHEDD